MSAGAVRVAVIDSGVHASHPHVGGVAGGAGIDEHGNVHDDFVDRLGHGTAVIAAIREKAPDAAIFAIKVFDRELAATGAALVAACEHALSIDAHIVNLSLGTQNTAHESALSAVVERLRAAGAIIVAAGQQDGVRWLPGSIRGVWPVLLDWNIPRDQWRLAIDEDQVSIYASGYPRPIPGVPPERNLKGLSFAVANATGLLAASLLKGDAADASEEAIRRLAGR